MKFSELPRALREVALFNLFVGGSAIIGSIVEMTKTGAWDLGGGLPLLLGYGLIRLSPTARKLQLFALWMLFIGLPVGVAAALAFLLREGDLSRIIPTDIATWKVVGGGVAAGVAYATGIWQYRVLTRPSIRSLFDEKSAGVRIPAPSPTID